MEYTKTAGSSDTYSSLSADEKAAGANGRDQADDGKWTGAEAIELFWNAGEPLVTPAQNGTYEPVTTPAARYLKGRRIGPKNIPCDEARFCPAHMANKKVKKKFPGLVFPLRNPDTGEIIATHTVRLKKCDDGYDKIDGDFVPKMTNGTGAPEAVAKFAAKAGAKDDRVVIVEGPEDALTIRAIAGCEVWATTSKGRLGAVLEHLVETGFERPITLWPDRDKESVADWLMVGKRFAGALSISIAETPDGAKDANELAQRVGKDGVTREDIQRLIICALDDTESVLPSETEEGPLDETGLELRRLASLKFLDYERERKKAAKRLGLRFAALDQLVTAERTRLAAAGLDLTALGFTATNDDQQNQRDCVIEIGSNLPLLTNAETSDAYVEIPVGESTRVVLVQGSDFASWLRRAYGEKFGHRSGDRHIPAGISDQALNEATATLAAMAEDSGDARAVWLRVGIDREDMTVYVDLYNEAGDVVVITADGWTVTHECPISFARPRGPLPLPRPKAGGSLDLLRELVNFDAGKDTESADDDFKTFVGSLLDKLIPDTPFLIDGIAGQQGAAKSTLCRVIRRLIDPHTLDLRTPPKDITDLWIASRSSYVVAYDNLSTLKPELSDAICRVSSGAAVAGRQFYTNFEEAYSIARRPIVLNGIPAFVERGDLAERTNKQFLKPIDERDRRLESDFWNDFEHVLPLIIGVLYDAISVALSRWHDVELEGKPRMADFAHLAVAAAPAFGWPDTAILDGFNRKQSRAAAEAIEDDPLAQAILKFLESRDEWEGSATELLSELSFYANDSVKESKSWPKSPNWLSNRLRRLAPLMRGEERLVIDPDVHTGKQRKVLIKHLPTIDSAIVEEEF